MKTIKQFLFIYFLAVVIYFSCFFDNQGLSNIASVILWIFTILFFLSLFSEEENENIKQSIVIKIFLRLCFISLIFALIFAGSILMGVIWIICAFVTYSQGKAKRITHE